MGKNLSVKIKDQRGKKRLDLAALLIAALTKKK